MKDQNKDTSNILPMYRSASEIELMKMWDDITGKNIDSLNRGLIKAIDKAENEEIQFTAKIQEEEITYANQMWDSENACWVPFDLWGAHFIINQRKEYLALRIYRPCAVQPEYGPTIKGWHSLDSSYLNEQLKDVKTPKENGFESFAGYQAFYEMIRQDRKEYEAEGRSNYFSDQHRLKA